MPIELEVGIIIMFAGLGLFAVFGGGRVKREEIIILVGCLLLGAFVSLIVGFWK